MTLGEKLRAWRLELDLSRQDVADQWGVHLNTVANWETNKTRPHYDVLLELVEWYGHSMEELV